MRRDSHAAVRPVTLHPRTQGLPEIPPRLSTAGHLIRDTLALMQAGGPGQGAARATRWTNGRALP